MQTYAGALVRRGEAVAEVTATGARTKFGRTAELVRTAHVVSSQQKAVLRVVRNLAVFNGVVIVLLVAYAWFLKMPLAEIIPLVLTAVLASIPVALPATFTLAAALGARALAKLGVLPTRLSAVDEAATMDVLCADKTGTLTRNALTVTTVRAMPGFDEAHVLTLAALASSDGGQDPVDAAIRAAAAARNRRRRAEIGQVRAVRSGDENVRGERQQMRRRDAADREGRLCRGRRPRTAVADRGHGGERTRGEGFQRAGGRGRTADSDEAGRAHRAQRPAARRLGGAGQRNCAAGRAHRDGDRRRAGDGRHRGARGGARWRGLPARTDPGQPSTRKQFAVFAGVLPEDKYKLVKAFQKGGHTVGMCGDGANDAPALRQAQIGIAVSTATDVAKSAAGMVLTEPGLAGIVAAVKEGRMTFQRILTYTLNSIIKKIVTVLFLIVGLVMTGHAILTPMLMVDRDDHRRLPRDVVDDGQRATVADAECVAHRQPDAGGRPSWAVACWPSAPASWPFGKFGLDLGIGALRTLAFVALVFGSQATIYAIRERRHLWGIAPEPLACRVVGCRYRNRFGVGRWRNRDDTPAGLARGRHARRSRGLCFRAGCCEGAGVRASADRVGASARTWREARSAVPYGPDRRATASRTALAGRAPCNIIALSSRPRKRHNQT